MVKGRLGRGKVTEKRHTAEKTAFSRGGRTKGTFYQKTVNGKAEETWGKGSGRVKVERGFSLRPGGGGLKEERHIVAS